MHVEGWKLIRDGVKTDDPANSGKYLGCDHQVGTMASPTTGKRVRSIQYDMSSFLESCVERYLELAKCPRSKLRSVATPFVEETQRTNGNRPNAKCTCCSNPVYCPSCGDGLKPDAKVISGGAPSEPVAVAAGLDDIAHGEDSSIPGGSCREGKSRDVPTEPAVPSESPQQGGKQDKTSYLEHWDDAGDGQPGAPRLQSIAAQVLMKILYAARMARFDLLKAVCTLASEISKWTAESDRKLHRLVSYINSTLHVKMTGWVGNDIKDISLDLFVDADVAGCDKTKRSTSGVFLSAVGSDTKMPLAAASRRQTCVSHSTPESEIVAFDYGLRAAGLPAPRAPSSKW